MPMPSIISLLILLFLTTPAFASTFFGDLEEAYLTVLAESVRQEPGNTNVYSIAIAYDRLPPGGIYPLPAAVWNKLRPRLEARGMNVRSYVPAPQVVIKNGQFMPKPGKRLTTTYIITDVQWHGDNRLQIALQCFRGQMNARGWTAILEMEDGKWTIVKTINGWIS